MTDKHTCRLYLISPPEIPDLDGFAELLGRTLDAGDVACFQLRLPGADDDTLRTAVAKLAPIVQGRDIAFLLADRPRLSKYLQCDGVHIEARDLTVKEVRKLVGDDMSVGFSCGNSRHAAMVAGEGGADYVSFGPFFPSPMKPDAEIADPDIVSWWAEMMELPCVAVGGMTPENCAAVAEAGADFIAAISSVWNHEKGPEEAVRAFNRVLEEATGQP